MSLCDLDVVVGLGFTVSSQGFLQFLLHMQCVMVYMEWRDCLNVIENATVSICNQGTLREEAITLQLRACSERGSHTHTHLFLLEGGLCVAH